MSWQCRCHGDLFASLEAINVHEQRFVAEKAANATLAVICLPDTITVVTKQQFKVVDGAHKHYKCPCGTVISRYCCYA